MLGESAGAFDYVVEIQAVVFHEVAVVVCCLLVVDCVFAACCDWDDVVEDEAVEVRPFEAVVDWFSADAAGWLVCGDGCSVLVADCSASSCTHSFTCLRMSESSRLCGLLDLFFGRTKRL